MLESRLKEIHDLVTLGLDEDKREHYNLFCEFMALYEREKALTHFAYKEYYENKETQK